MDKKPKAEDGQGRCVPLRDRDATLSIPIRDPALSAIEFISPPLKLYTLKQHLANFTLAYSKDPAGFNFENFTRNIRGLKYVSIEGRGYEILFTRSSAFLTCNGTPVAINRLSDILGPDAVERVSFATSQDGGVLTICRITGREIRKILESSSPGQRGVMSADSIVPPESAEYIEPEEFKAKLRHCAVTETDGKTDIFDFVSRISLVQVFNDEREGGNFIIGLSGDDLVYAMYVNAEAPAGSEQNPMLFRLRYNDREECVIYRVEVIG